MTEWDLAYMRRRVQPTDADIDRIADAVSIDKFEARATTWHRRFARAVLAAQPAPVPKPVPVAWGAPSADGKIYIAWHERTDACTIPLYTHPAAPVPAKCDGGTCGAGGYCDNCPKQAAAPVPVPLTADDIWLLWTRACEKPQLTRDLVCDFARAIEAAHGIAASPEVPHG